MKCVALCVAVILIGIVACEKEPIVIDDSSTLPIIKLSIDDKYLWSPDSGLYINANVHEKWEFPAEIEYLENGEQLFRNKVGFRLKGNASRGNSMKSFGIYWRKEYGNKSLKFPMFPDITTTKFKRLFLRNSGNDFGKTHLKDASISMVYKDFANVEYQAYKPCVLYLNNAYWGIYNIREMITPHHFDYHFGVDDDHLDLLQGSELNPSADDGTTDDFKNDVINFLKQNDLRKIDNYNIIKNLIDIDSYIDYIIINTYICNTDWPLGNAKWWRDKTSSTYLKWRWVVFDTDWSLKGKENLDKIWIGDLYGNHFDTKKNEGFFIFNSLLKNKEFKSVFLDRYMFFITTVFEKQRFENIVLANKNRIEIEYNNHQQKWNTLNKNQWNKAIGAMIEFNTKRNDKMKSIISELQNENK